MQYTWQDNIWSIHLIRTPVPYWGDGQAKGHPGPKNGVTKVIRGDALWYFVTKLRFKIKGERVSICQGSNLVDVKACCTLQVWNFSRCELIILEFMDFSFQVLDFSKLPGQIRFSRFCAPQQMHRVFWNFSTLLEPIQRGVCSDCSCRREELIHLVTRCKVTLFSPPSSSRPSWPYSSSS